jgi:glycosyltransferase involved in cell wall biosynthesis
MPKVSILVPAYNHEQFAAATIESVLNQTFTDFELLVNDDASTDGTFAELSKFKDSRIVLSRNDRNRGVCATSEICWLKSRGEFICWLATDDIYEPQALEVLINHLNEDKALDGAFGTARFIDESGKLTGENWTDEGVGLNRFDLLRNLFYGRNLFCATASMVRRTMIDRVGYRNVNLLQLGDLEHWIRMLFEGQLKIFSEPIVRYRQRADNKNLSAPRSATAFARSEFELFQILILFLKQITSTEILLKLFPEVSSLDIPIKTELIPFILAKLALERRTYGSRLFATHVLFDMMSDPDIRKLLERECNFTTSDLFKYETENIGFLSDDSTDVALVEEKLRLQEETSNRKIETFRQKEKTSNRVIEELSLQNDRLRNKLNAVRTHADAQENTIEELRNSKTRLREEFNTISRKTQTLERILDEHQAQIRDWKISNEDLASIINQQSGQLSRRSVSLVLKLVSIFPRI